jgi:hypothetical protein
MSIDVKKFIDINIVYSKQTSNPLIQNTVGLITSEGTEGTITLVLSKSEWDAYIIGKTFTNTTPYVNMFFANGGTRLAIIEGKTGAYATSLSDEYIAIAVVDQTFSSAKSLATTLELSMTGIHKKILLARATSSDIASDPLVSGLSCLAVKYSEYVGAEMCMGAYLSKTKIDGINTVNDYAFTIEDLEVNVSSPITNNVFDTLMGYKFNFNIALSNANRNIGGNMTSGRSLINEYMLIVLHQVATARLLDLLVTKIKGNKALSAIRSTLSDTLNIFVQNGYLSTSKVWIYDDWVVTHNSQEFTIIEQYTPLSLGYHIQVLPWSSLTNQEIAENKAPTTYIIIADAYGVRKLELAGGLL